jgi:hypothetical protein
LAPREQIQDLFLWKGRVNVLESSGRAFERHEDEWKPSNLQFKPRSVVVATETLVACNPGPLQMTSTERGSCYSPTAGWSVELNQRRVRPAICGGHLNAIEVRRGVVWARQLRPADGVELALTKLDRLLPTLALSDSAPAAGDALAGLQRRRTPVQELQRPSLAAAAIRP